MGVAVCSDLRYGRELQTIATDFPKVFEMNPYLWVGLPGLATDIQTVKQKIEFRMNMYLIGCITEPVDFVAGGTCEEQLMGMCETLWEPKMKPDQLFECISQAVMNAMDRDAISGWGAVVHIIEKDKVTTRTLKTRMD